MNPITFLKGKVGNKIVNHVSVGEIQRANAQLNVKNKAIYRGIVCFETHIPKANISSLSQEDFEIKWQRFITDLHRIFQHKKDVINAHDAIAKAIDTGTKKGFWNVGIPTHFNFVRREKPFKSKVWFENAAILQTFESNWLKDIQATTDLKVLLYRCLYSAMFHSGLNEKHHVESLYEALKTAKPLKIRNNIIWLDLVIDPAEFRNSHKTKCAQFPFSTNTYQDEKEVLVSRFFPATTTLAFINHYLKVRDKSKTEFQRGSIANFWKKISAEIKECSGKSLTAKQICEASVGIIEIKPNVECPEALIEFMTKRNMSYSLPLDNWLKLSGSHKSLEIDSLLYFKSNINKVSARDELTCSKQQKAKPTFGLIADLKSALKIHHSNKKRRTNAELINSVTNVFETCNNPTLHETIFVKWLLFLLESGRKPRTLTRYFSAIGTLWFTEAEIIDEEQTSEFFEALYAGMLETTSSEKDLAYKKGLLIQLHKFAVLNFGLPRLVNFTKNGSGAIPHVKSAYVSESMFNELFKSINSCKNARLIEKQTLLMILIFSYRTGLRLGEVLKLKISDFEWSPVGWLFIRNNDFDTNKTNAARRKIPLICLLTRDELVFFREYIKTINFVHKKKTSPNKLLFSFAENRASPVENFLVSNIVSQLLTEISQLKLFVFHSLRHTALSRMQLLMHDKEFDICSNLGNLRAEVIPYDGNQISTIMSVIFGDRKLEKYWSLACFAGHRNPQITFNSYLHFSDFITYCCLNKNQQCFSLEKLATMSGLSKRSIKRGAASAGEVEVNSVRELILERLQKAKYCQKYQQTAAKKIKSPFRTQPSTKDSSQTFDHIRELLVATESGESVERLLWLYDIEQHQLDSWINKAKLINEITTSKAKSRNISNNRHSGLITPLPKTQVDIEEIIYLREFLREKLAKKAPAERKELLSRIFSTVLTRTNTSGSELLFRHPSTLKIFLDFMSFFPKKRWFIKLNASNKEDLKDWKKVTKGCHLEVNKDFVQDKRNPNGQVKLYLLSKQQPDNLTKNNWKKYSTNTIKCVFNIIAIATLTESEILSLQKL